MQDNKYNFWGMHLIWWIVWVLLLFWIFAIPYDIPGQRSKKETPVEMLRHRFAAGEISQEEYQKKRQVLEQEIFTKP